MKGQPGISLLLAVVLAGNGAAISGQECDVTQRPSAAALLFATPSTHGTGVYVLDEDLGRRYLITAYHNVYTQADIQVAGLNRALARPLHALVDQVLYAPELDLAVYPCAANCQRLLEGEELDRRPMLMPLQALTGRAVYHDLKQPFLVLSNFAITYGFSGGPLVYSASNFCERFELAGMVQGGDPTGNLSWAVPLAAILETVRRGGFDAYPHSAWPEPRFPKKLRYADVEPYLELLDWLPKAPPGQTPEGHAIPAVQLVNGESTELSVILRTAMPSQQLAATLVGGSDLIVQRSPEIVPLPDGTGLQKFAWQVKPLAAQDQLRHPRDLAIAFYTESGETGFSLPFQLRIQPSPRGIERLIAHCRLVADPNQPVYLGLSDQC